MFSIQYAHIYLQSIFTYICFFLCLNQSLTMQFNVAWKLYKPALEQSPNLCLPQAGISVLIMSRHIFIFIQFCNSLGNAFEFSNQIFFIPLEPVFLRMCCFLTQSLSSNLPSPLRDSVSWWNPRMPLSHSLVPIRLYFQQIFIALCLLLLTETDNLHTWPGLRVSNIKQCTEH